MDLLLSSEIFLKYLSTFSNFTKDSLENCIHSLFINPNNKFLLSKSLIEILEESVKKDKKLESFLGPFLTNLMDVKTLNVPSKTKNDEMKVLEEMDSNYEIIDSQLRKDIYLNISFNESLSLGKSNSIIIEKIKKPNFHWLAFNLACFHPNPVTIRYFDCKTDAEIESIFKIFFNLNNSISSIDIFDRQTNVKHKLYNSIVKKTHVNYFTSRKRFPTDELDENQLLKNHFGKINIYKAKPNDIHERKVIAKNLVLEIDDDFWNLSESKSTWKIDITYSPEIAKSLCNKKTKFSKVN